ncbi:hypothetical protein Q4555_04970 [Octadecabacter sp. 1_MG-2023]|uniref:hypothetical protein n=1 Tax=unclassified Octadecabacter TaxID=196158 RepID=UPI001C080CEE|nr:MULTISPECIES: hypothetical protein [unclassified Octadecabacter]MBU2994699.1 hypothetical protein [Octadecabacter sp. B2R22]MDO6734007.1 hypothetical protein [Octadecabacter sp. 1_MG-2023]
MKFLFATFLGLISQSAWAGCADFTRSFSGELSPPVYRICYDGVCDVTTQDYVCSNVSSYQDGYAIGWTRDCQILSETETQCQIRWQGRPIDPAKHYRLTFEEVSTE